MPAKDTSLLTQAQKDTLKKIEIIASLCGVNVKGITLKKSAYKEFVTICNKAAKYLNHTTYAGIDPVEFTYKGIEVRCIGDKRKIYTEGDTASLF